jgi:disease resistance protein RPM1
LLKNLTSLEVLEAVTVTYQSFAEEFVRLTQLRKLKVMVLLPKGFPSSKQAWGKVVAESLGKIQRIEDVHFSFDNPCDLQLIMDGSVEPLWNLQHLYFSNTIGVVPTWIKGVLLPILSKLDIGVCHEQRDDIQVLGTLPCLRRLRFHVWGRAQQALERSEVGPNAFPRVVRCEFAGLGRAQGVVPSVFPRGAMPKLEDYRFLINLKEDFCGRGASYTIDNLMLAHLPSLRSVIVFLRGKNEVGEEVVRSVREKLKYEATSHLNHPRLDISTP